MAIHRFQIVLLFSFSIFFSSFSGLDLDHPQSSSQVQILLKIKLLLNSPPLLNTWSDDTVFCNSESTETLTVVCYEESITQLHIVGDSGTPRLPDNFSIDSFVTELIQLPTLKVLTLVSLGLWGPLPGNLTCLSSLEIANLTSNYLHGEIPPSISSMENLQTLILERNNLTGVLPNGIGSLSSLAVLNLKNNSFYGILPQTLEKLKNLRVLVLSGNRFSGEVPDFSGLTNLQVLALESNALGPRFPITGDKIESIVLGNNKFTFGIPEEVRSYYQLKTLDISSNRFVGPFPVSLFSLPSVFYIDIAGNKFTGMLSENLPCNDELYFVNLTDNLLTGKLPGCFISGSKRRAVLYGGNCLETGVGNQRPVSFCKNAALAVGILPRPNKRKRACKVIIGTSIFGGVVGGVVLVSAAFLAVKNFLAKRDARLQRSTVENASTSYTSKILKDARYITQAMKLGGLGLPAYRMFSVEELVEATNNFDTSALMGEGSHGQMYKGQLSDGSFVAIRCLKLKRNYSVPHIEMISKLRHHHLVSALGHCFEYYLDDSCVNIVFLVFEYVPDGTLRSWISERCARRKLTWAQRLSAATGVAKGIQFLHTRIVPSLVANNIKITDVLIDQHLVSKISSYNLPLLSDSMGKDNLQNYLGGSKEFKGARAKHQDKLDIHDFGVILLEIIMGNPINSRNEFKATKYQLEASMIADDISRKSSIDPEIRNTCSPESVKTTMEICCRCLHEDPSERPSIEDVLWNLQFAAQVQDASDSSPISPLQSSRLKLANEQ